VQVVLGRGRLRRPRDLVPHPRRRARSSAGRGGGGRAGRAAGSPPVRGFASGRGVACGGGDRGFRRSNQPDGKCVVLGSGSNEIPCVCVAVTWCEPVPFLSWRERKPFLLCLFS
jgi:hypothetical protein